MLDIIKFNFKRMKSKWYLILAIMFIFYFYFLLIDIGSLIISDISEEPKIELMDIRNKSINISLVMFFIFFTLYLYKDYQNGIWNHLISSGIKSKNIILAYLLNSFIISITNLTIYFIWSLIFYRNYLANYGIFEFFINNFFKQFSLIISIFIISILIFKFSPYKKEFLISFLVLLLLYSLWFESYFLLFSIYTNSKILKISFSVIPLINISMIDGSNEYIWLAILINYALLVSGALIFALKK
ncbi:hypothetical protein SCANT_v1c02110 [Spiroplasma cantharicola]|uniref:ABC transporter permease n=1 Tax=Spiroplasma cantharicola TaxID=362837 RepID=A0A0M4JS42_9MOLU|nr:hypothetical protein SCANT_v1c02110 [Spiroplasma cantharicola]